MANRRFASKFFNTFHKQPTMLTAKFTVLSTNPQGCTGFAGPQAGTFGGPDPAKTTFGNGIAAVQMFSSAPAAGNVALAGQIIIQLQDNYQQFLGMTYTLSNVVTGANIAVSTGFTVGTFYQITALGTTTTAQWQAVGVPAGVTPVVGMPFQASTSSAGTGNGTAKALTISNLNSIEVASDPTGLLQPTGQAVGFQGGSGGWIYLTCWKALVQTAPTDGTVITLNLLLNSP